MVTTNNPDNKMNMIKRAFLMIFCLQVISSLAFALEVEEKNNRTEEICQSQMRTDDDNQLTNNSRLLNTDPTNVKKQAQNGNVTNLPSQAEYDALIAIYESTNGSEWTTNYGWVDADPNIIEDVSNWYGVTTYSGHVTRLQINNNNVTGTLPDEIGDLVNLEILYLMGNQIGGSIPASIGNLNNLQVIYAHDNQFSGSLPSTLGDLDNLQYLYLAYNLLSGDIPVELGGMPSLEFIDLGNNQLTGNVPSELGSNSLLKSLELNSNQLSGNIPAELGNLSNLYRLNLFDNQLSGSIPLSLGNLTNLIFLYLNDNQLSGTIPSSLGNLTTLRHLYLNDNQLTGTIPFELGGLNSVQYLLMGNNQLTGSVPSQLGNLSSIVKLGLSSNQLSGSIPPELGNLSTLQYLELQDNQLTGSIPNELSNLGSLQSLYLQNNQLSDNISSLIGNLESLTLYIDNNHFTFSNFLELKQNFSGISFNYSPQDSVGTTKNISATAGETLTLSTEIDRNTVPPSKYQWYKNGVPIGTLDVANYTLTISNVTLEDAGIYHYAIQNDDASDLTLTSRNIIVDVNCKELEPEFAYYPHSCGTKFLPIFENEKDCNIISYYWDFGDGSTSTEVEPFHVYATQDTFEVTLKLTLDCHEGCGSRTDSVSHTVDLTKDIFEQFQTINIETQIIDSVLSASSSSFSDNWLKDYDDEDLLNSHPYLNGSKGVWRNDASFVYREDRGSSTGVDIQKDGTFQLESFNWAMSEYDAIPR